MNVGLLNSAIFTSNGLFKVEDIDVEQAKQIANTHRLESYIGHEPTAAVMSKLLGIEIPVNRQHFTQMPGQVALVFRMNKRLPEGVILSEQEIADLGYEWKKITRIE